MLPELDEGSDGSEESMADLQGSIGGGSILGTVTSPIMNQDSQTTSKGMSNAQFAHSISLSPEKDKN